jgi:hypothetical protein
MKRLNITISGFLGIFAFCALSAQVEDQVSATTSNSAEEVATETTEKTYKIIMNDKVVKNSVNISTSITQDVMLNEADKDLFNQQREIPKKHIVKTVKIDNDEDDDYDELITFRYYADVATDFILITNDDEIYVGLDDGENLKILENRSYKVDDVTKGKEAYIFTDNNGAEVEFFIDEYKSLDETSNK